LTHWSATVLLAAAGYLLGSIPTGARKVRFFMKTRA
jgi:glycerol-3-phosphate acyltransferase PlsY